MKQIGQIAQDYTPAEGNKPDVVSIYAPGAGAPIVAIIEARKNNPMLKDCTARELANLAAWIVATANRILGFPVCKSEADEVALTAQLEQDLRQDFNSYSQQEIKLLINNGLKGAYCTGEFVTFTISKMYLWKKKYDLQRQIAAIKQQEIAAKLERSFPPEVAPPLDITALKIFIGKSSLPDSHFVPETYSFYNNLIELISKNLDRLMEGNAAYLDYKKAAATECEKLLLAKYAEQLDSLNLELAAHELGSNIGSHIAKNIVAITNKIKMYTQKETGEVSDLANEIEFAAKEKTVLGFVKKYRA